MNINFPETVSFIRDYSYRFEELADLELYAENNHVPIIHIEAANLIRALIELYKPVSMLEIGTAIGYSAIFFSKCNEEMNVTTIEKNPEMVKLANLNIDFFGLKNKIEVVEGDALDVIPNLDKEFDFIFIDASKSSYSDFFRLSEKLLKKGGMIVTDNILFKGMVCNNNIVTKNKRTIVNNLKKFLDELVQNEKFITSLIPIGDGLAFSVKCQ